MHIMGSRDNAVSIATGYGLDEGAFPRGVKRPRREADNSTRTIAEIKDEWILISTPTYAPIA
jgi:hypothetical protein